MRPILTLLTATLIFLCAPVLAQAGGPCGNGDVDPGEDCDLGQFGGSPVACCDSDCSFSAPSKICRPSENRCDVDDHCSGSSQSCGLDYAIAGSTSHSSHPSTGHCYVYFLAAVDWTTAHDDCVALGGYLAAVDTEQEDSMLNNANSYGWIGIHDRDTEAGTSDSSFVRVTGGSVDYSEFNPSQPDGVLPGDDCVFRNEYGWHDQACSELETYYCELEPVSCGDGITQPAEGEQCDLGAANGDASSCCASDCTFQPAATACRRYGDCQVSGAVCDGSSGQCPAGGALLPGASGAAYDARSGHCYAGFETAASWESAEASCEGLDGYLAAVEDGVENVLARDTVGSSAVWIGISDRRREAVNSASGFQRVTGGGLTYNGFDVGEPDYSPDLDEDCVHVRDDNYSWHDSPCETARSYVCEIGGPELPTCPAAPVDCRQGEHATGSLSIRRDTVNPVRNAMKWKWNKGELTPFVDSGDPVNFTSYRLCLYDGGGDLQTDILLPPGGDCGGKPCWKALGGSQVTGARYLDKSGTTGGITRLQLKGGGDGAAQLQVQAKGSNFAAPLPLVVTPELVQMQLFNNATTQCWGAAYQSSDAPSTDEQYSDRNE